MTNGNDLPGLAVPGPRGQEASTRGGGVAGGSVLRGEPGFPECRKVGGSLRDEEKDVLLMTNHRTHSGQCSRVGKERAESYWWAHSQMKSTGGG